MSLGYALSLVIFNKRAAENHGHHLEVASAHGDTFMFQSAQKGRFDKRIQADVGCGRKPFT